MVISTKEKKPVISVIIPIYNTEAYLEKCLKSIIRQTYSNLEIICVNDCSPGQAKSIVSEFMEEDKRIKYVEHDKNQGLFRARVTGSEHATGDFIAFVDSDDHISIDYYRLLIDKAISKNADIVEGRIIRENESGEKFIQNLNNILLEDLEGEQIRDAFFSQEGCFYHWHVIWNKLYSMELWKKCLPYFQKQTEHLIMTEDVVFSSLLFYNAKKYTSIKEDGYFYYIRAEASTGAASDVNKFLKNIKDMGTAFNFVETYINHVKGDSKYISNLSNWKKSYYRLWAARIKNENLSSLEKNKVLLELKKNLGIQKDESLKPEDYYHSIINTPWDPRLENLKILIANKEFEYISFDIFDTLVVRPFYDPRDLLILLDDYFHEIYPESPLVEFSALRLQAESHKREVIKIENPLWQDINLNEIYEYIEQEYNLPSEIVRKLKEKEVELELKFIQRRETIYQLYKLALELNKKVILVSDMYLSYDVISDILNKTGYIHYHKLYVSSETRLLKHTGDMFSYVVDDLNANPDSILHIGDNWDSDKVMAERNGWRSYFIGKTMDLMLNRLSDKETGNSLRLFQDMQNENWFSFEHPEYLSIRCMVAMAANKIFDNPFVSFNSDSDFNSDPYFIGYYALGMHVFGLSKWLIEDSIKNGHNTIHFIARDGYLPQKVYNIVAGCYSNAPKSNYIYASRKSLLPFLLMSNNYYGLDSFMSIYAHSPKSILELLKDFVIEDSHAILAEKYGIPISKNFASQYEYKKFLDVFNKVVDTNKVSNYIETLNEYYSNRIKKNDATFDLGYSARLQTIIVSILKRSCDSYFVHTSKEVPWRFSQRNRFRLKSFYQFKPKISGILREHLFAELAPSCIGFNRAEDGEIEPVFEDYLDNHINRLVVTIIQNSAIDFAKDMMKIFGEYVSALKVRNAEVSLPLETYIHFSKPSDRVLFKHSYSDDTVHGGNDRNSILDWWNNEISLVQRTGADRTRTVVHYNNHTDLLYNRGKIVKVIYFALFDRDTLKKKVKQRYSGKPITLKVMSSSYRLLRRVKAIIMK